MSFWENTTLQERKSYENHLDETIRTNHHLCTDSNNGYLYYRTHEIIFNKSFGMVGCARDDISVDAYKVVSSGKVFGIGCKTFLIKRVGNIKSEKIAEFDKDLSGFSGSDYDRVIKVARSRNDRLDNTKNKHNITDMVYHLLGRSGNKLYIFEMPMLYIDEKSILLKQKREGCKNIPFSDQIMDYTLDIAKSTLKVAFSLQQRYLKHTINLSDFLSIDEILTKQTRSKK